MIIIGTILAYFCVLLLLSRVIVRVGDNDAFFRANRKSPWYLVAFGMIGASISGVTFVSVPGMVINQNMAYAQTCIGFIFGYFLVAFLLLPIYYKLNLTTIYSYLKNRLGNRSYKTGAVLCRMYDSSAICSRSLSYPFSRYGYCNGLIDMALHA